MSAPLIVLGVRRSGTTLLRVMLERNSQIALPDESYFLPQLAARHGARPDPDRFVDDVRRLPTIKEWGLNPEAIRGRIRPNATLGEALAAIYEEYAALQGKARWGDKTPMYMQYLRMLERLFPTARYVHLIRDGRDAAVSFLSMPKGVVTETWAHPRAPGEFACQWRTEVEDARALGRRVGERYLEVRYEVLASEPEVTLRRVCDFASLPWEDEMLKYAGKIDVSAKPHQQSLRRPPTPGLRDWRRELAPVEVHAFQDVAGDLLGDLGYELANGAPPRRPTRRARVRLARYRALTAAWRTAAWVLQRSPVWRRRHPPLV